MKKIILSYLIISYLTIGLIAHAALTVPKNAPLQPIPAGVGVDTSHNINSPNTDSNKALQQESNQAQNKEQQEVQNPEDNQPASLTPVTATTPTGSGTIYILWLTVGILGLLGAGFWIYYRFYRDQ